MAKLRSRRWSDVSTARRALVSALALCLFALQALVAASLVRAHDAPLAGGVSASAYCEPHRDGAPPAERDHAPCCILCVASRDLPSLAEPPSAEPTLAPVAFAFVAYASTAPPQRGPAGWASSWSSRAPPLA